MSRHDRDLVRVILPPLLAAALLFLLAHPVDAVPTTTPMGTSVATTP